MANLWLCLAPPGRTATRTRPLTSPPTNIAASGPTTTVSFIDTRPSADGAFNQNVLVQSFSEFTVPTTRTARCASRSTPRPRRSSRAPPTSWVSNTKIWCWSKSSPTVGGASCWPDENSYVHIHPSCYDSTGEKTVLNDNEVSIPTSLSINGRIFVSPKDHLDAMVTAATTLVPLINSLDTEADLKFGPMSF